MSKRGLTGLSVVLGACFCAVAMLTPAIAQQNEDYGKRIAQNAKELRAYSWTKRTEIRQQGEVVATRVEKVRYDIDGKIQRTPLGGEGEITTELVTESRNLVDRGFAYAQPDPNSISTFLQQKASFWEGKGAGAGTGSAVPGLRQGQTRLPAGRRGRHLGLCHLPGSHWGLEPPRTRGSHRVDRRRVRPRRVRPGQDERDFARIAVRR